MITQAICEDFDMFSPKSWSKQVAEPARLKWGLDRIQFVSSVTLSRWYYLERDVTGI